MEQILRLKISVVVNVGTLCLTLLLFFASPLRSSNQADVLDLPVMQDFLQMLEDDNLAAFFEKEFLLPQKKGERAQIVYKKNRKERFDFYKEYIAKYYPKVFVIREKFFAHMDAEEIVDALGEVVKVLSNDTWFYIQDNPKNFKRGRYWEYVIDQLSYFNQFLENARIDACTGVVFLPDEDDDLYLEWLLPPSLQTQTNDSIEMLEYLQETNNMSVIYDFYALSFDFLIKLFNEGILFYDASQAYSYLSELEYVVEKLEGSEYEAEYKEHFATCKQLLSLLRQQLGDDDPLWFDDWSTD